MIRPGQFWRDTVNGDLLKILESNLEIIETGNPFEQPRPTREIVYAKCACIVEGKYFGIQEMKASHLAEERFQQVARVKRLWYRWKYRKAGQ